MSDNGKTSDIEAALSTVDQEKEEKIYTLSTGIRVRFTPVNSMIIQSAMSRIKNPQVPIVVDKEQGRDYENPDDPRYILALTEARTQRGYARLNTIILWGMILADGLPENDDWLYKLQFQERQGDLDLSDFDFKNPIDKEFAYKKFIAIGDKLEEDGTNTDITLVLNQGFVNEEAIESASDSFQGDKKPETDQERTPEASGVVSE